MHNIRSLCFLLLGLSGFLNTLLAGPVIDAIRPIRVDPGASVALIGSGFDPAVSYTVRVGEDAVVIESVTAGQIVFRAPESLHSGIVTLEGGGASVVAPLLLQRRRLVQGRLALPRGVDASAYDVCYGFVPVNPDAEGRFPVYVGVDDILVVNAVNIHDETGPDFMALIVPGMEAVVIDARSTAATLALLTPGLMTRDPALAVTRMTTVHAQTELDRAAKIIGGISATGADYSQDQRLVDALSALVEATVADLPPLVPPGVAGAGIATQGKRNLAAAEPSGIFDNLSPITSVGEANFLFNGGESIDLNQDFSPNQPFGALVAVPTSRTDTRRGREFVDISVEGRFDQFQPVDWYVEVYEIDPTSYPNLSAVRNLPGDHVPVYLHDKKPIATGYVRAQLLASNFDALEVAAKAAVGALGIGDIGFKVTLPKDKPGLFIVQAYSGNVYYGARGFQEDFSAVGDQADLLDQTDHHGLWKWALGANLFSVAIDTVSTALPASQLVEDSLSSPEAQKKLAVDSVKLVDALLVNVGKTAPAVLGGGPASTNQGTVTTKRAEELIFEIMQSCVQGFANLVISLTEDALKNAAEEGASVAAKSVKAALKTIDVLGRVSSAGQAAQRFAGIMGGRTRALERYIIVVDNPFRPVIATVNPAAGSPGTILEIIGDNFTDGSFQSRIATATLCTYEGNDPDGAVTSVAPLEILEVERGYIRAQVPDSAIEVLGDAGGRAHICLTANDGEATFSTIQILGYAGFEVLPYPVIESTSLGANPVITDETNTFSLVMNAENLRPEELVVKALDPHGLSLGKPRIISVSGKTVKLDTTSISLTPGQSFTLTVQRRTFVDDPANVSSIEVIRPENPMPLVVGVVDAPRTELEGGLDLVVDSLANTIADDGVLTLLEAILIASNGIEATYPAGSIEGPKPCENFSTGSCVRNINKDYEAMASFGRGSTSFANFTTIVTPVNPEDPYRLGGGGRLSRDTISLHENLIAQIASNPGLTWIPDRALPKFHSGDSLLLAGLIISGSGLPATAAALDFTGVSEATVQDATFRDFAGDGLLVAGTAPAPVGDVFFLRVNFENCGGRGIVLTGDVSNIVLRGVKVDGAQGSALVLDGPGVRGNRIDANVSFSSAFPSGFNHSATGYGIHILNGARDNVLMFGSASGNALGGIRVEGAATDGNTLGAGFDTVNASGPSNFVEANGGAGIFLGAGVENTLIRFVNIAGNNGDGIRFEGAGNQNNTVIGVSMGAFLGSITKVDPRNHGDGIHVGGGARLIQIGNDESRRFAPGLIGSSTGDDRNYIEGNTGNGIHIEGPDSGECTIYTTYVGPATANDPNRLNGLNNILINAGSSGNVIGDTAAMWVQFSTFGDGTSIQSLRDLLALRVRNATNGAGILLDNAHDNLIMGNSFFGNKIGVHLRNGSSGNRVGLPSKIGQRVVERHLIGSDLSITLHRPGNFFGRHTDAAITVEDSGGRLDVAQQVVGRNVFTGNYIGAADERLGALDANIGIRITGESFYNVFGGPEPDEGNTIANSRIGVIFDAYTQGSPEQRNQFINNRITSNGTFTREFGFEYGAAQGYDPLPGHGVVIHDSSGVVFGEDIQAPNVFTRNNFGIYIDNSTDSVIRGNLFDNNDNQAIVIYTGARNKIGDSGTGQFNRFINNGDADQETEGAIGVYFAFDNIIQGNLFGEVVEKERTPTDRRLGNRGPSIYINGSIGTLIGGAYRLQGNTIVQNEGPAILVENFARQSIIANNRIGVLDEQTVLVDEAYLSNDGPGIHLRANATNNQIGGLVETVIDGILLKVPAGNTIARSSDAGVVVEGAGSLGNAILSNSIFGNAGDGISLRGGGNGNVPRPVSFSFDGETLASPAGASPALPPGATIQVFADFDTGTAEGFGFVGETTVAEDGSWAVRGLGLMPAPALAVTVTTPTEGTSAFAQVALNAAYEIQGPDTTSTPAKTLARDRLRQVVLPFQVTARGARLRFTALRLTASETFNESSLDGVEVYRDGDGDGELSAKDSLLGQAGAFAADDGELLVTLADSVVEVGQAQQWLVVYRFKAEALPAAGETLAVAILGSGGVEAFLAGGAYRAPVVSEAAFPVASAALVAGNVGFPAWLAENFPLVPADPAITGPSGDVDGDGRPNLVEYFEGTDPLVVDAGFAGRLSFEEGRLVFRKVRQPGRDDLAVQPELIFALTEAEFGASPFGEPTVEAGPGGRETLVYRSTVTLDQIQAIFARVRLTR